MNKRLYNFDALRFIAAWIVLLCHVEVLKPHFGIEPLTGRFFVNSAQIAVTFFFVLSGFLITWVLLIEKRKDHNERINLWGFYRKRILRIWPLYYLLLLLGFFVLRQINFFSEAIPTNYFNGTKHHTALVYYILFLPNYAEFRFGAPVYIGQVWSLGVEEFFYLFFPLAIYLIPFRRISYFLLYTGIFFIVFSICIRIFLTDPSGRFERLLFVYTDKYRLYSFTLGGLAAYFCLDTNSILKLKKYLSKRSVSYGLLFFTFVLIIMGRTFSVVTQQAYSVLFAVLLLSTLSSGIKPWLLNNPVIVYLGKISYGIYMLHAIAIIVALKYFYPMLSTGIQWLDTITIFLYATVLTIILSMISWHFYEKLFLKFRTRFKR